MRLALFLILFFCSCGQIKQQDKSIVADRQKENRISKIDVGSNLMAQIGTPIPTTFFLDFSNYLDSNGYFADTVRAKKVSQQLSKATIIIFKNKPFYFVNPSMHEIQSAWQSLVGNYLYDSLKTNIDYSIFHNPTAIYAYYFRQDQKETLFEDGIIEEWHFKTEKEAADALIELNKVKDLVYFNTNSFTFQKDNFLYIFHTRAAAFHITLHKFFKTFKQRRT